MSVTESRLTPAPLHTKRLNYETVDKYEFFSVTRGTIVNFGVGESPTSICSPSLTNLAGRPSPVFLARKTWLRPSILHISQAVGLFTPTKYSLRSYFSAA